MTPPPESPVAWAALDAVPVGVTVHDPAAAGSVAVYANPAFYRQTGLTPGEVIGRPCRVLAHLLATAPADADALLAAVAAGREYRCEWHQPRADGSRRWAEVTARPTAGPPGRLVVTHIDIDARKSAEERFALAAAAVRGIVYEWEPDTGHVHRSSGLTEVLGYDPAAVPPTADWWMSLIHPDDGPDLRPVGGRDRVELEYRVRHADGHYVRLIDRLQTLRRADGSPARVVGCSIDVTDRERAAAAARERERQLADVLEAGELGFWDWHLPSGRVTYGGRWAAMLGYDLADVAADLTAWERLAHPDDRDRLVAGFDAHARTGAVYEADFRMRAADGTWRWVRTRGRVTERDAAGGPVRAAGVHIDIHATKRTELELADSRRMLDRIALTCPCLVFVSDPVAGVAHYLNAAAGGILGLSPAEAAALAGRSFRPLLHPDDLDRIRAHVTGWDATPDGAVREIEYRLRHADGSYRWLHFRSTAFDRHPDGRVSRVVGFGVDVTADRERAEKQREQDERFRETQKLESLGVLAGGIAHDFNNLLTVMLGNAELAAAEVPPGSPARESLGRIADAAQRAAGVCRQMLAYAGKGRFVVAPHDLSDVVARTHQLLAAGTPKGTAWHLDLPPGLPPVSGDAAQLEQVAMNLLSNAAEATPAGDVRVSVRLVEADRAALDGMRFGPDRPPGAYVEFRVADTGCGMTDDVRAKMFDPFFSTKFAGRGLGLSAALGIVRCHAGAIRVDTAEGRGTTVTVLFPAAQPVTPPPKPATTGKASGAVLVADDEPLVLRLATAHLTALGFAPVVPAADGRAAVAAVRADPDRFRLAVLDLTMPGMDGLQAFEEMRRHAPGLPVVLMSGYSEADVRERFGRAGFAGFLPKPFTRDDLARLATAAVQS